MGNHGRRLLVRWGWLPIVGVLVQPGAASAQMAPAMMVERTPNYTVVLTIGPAEQMLSPMDAMTAKSGEVMVGGGSMATSMGGAVGTMSSGMDQGMSVNHHLEVQFTRNDTGAVANDVTPTIRVTDKATGESRDLPQVMGMYGVQTGPRDFHYGQNVWLPDGTYTTTVMVGPDVAIFRDVMLMGNAPMSAGSMGSSGSMGSTSSNSGAP